MKRIIAILLVIGGLVSFASCGGQSTSQNSETESKDATEATTVIATEALTEAPTQTPTEKSNVIKPKNKAIIDNSYVKVTVTKMYEDTESVYLNKDYKPSCVEFKIKNKLNREILFEFVDGFIGEDEIEFVGTDGNTIPAKRTVYRTFTIEDNVNNKPISPLKKLYKLEGVLEIKPYTKDKQYLDGDMEKEFDFKLKKLK